MLARAFDADVPARWVVADSFDGRSHAFRRWLEERGCASAVMIPKTNAVQYQEQRLRAEQLGEQLSATAERPAWACLALSEDGADGMRRWLLIRPDADDPSDDAYFLAYGPEGTSDAELIRVCNIRWQVEEGFAQAKGEVGLDHDAVRTWEAWQRFVTLCLLAHARVPSGWHRRHAPGCSGRRNREKRGADADLISLTVPEVRRLVLAMTATDERRTVRFGWSRWRRGHQGRAARCHAARHARGRDRPTVSGTAVPLPPVGAGLTDAEGERVRPLMPPQKPVTGRPRHDHRMVLSGILWVVRSDYSWREMPKAFGKWEAAYKRYQLWCDHGLWQCLMDALGNDATKVSL